MKPWNANKRKKNNTHKSSHTFEIDGIYIYIYKLYKKTLETIKLKYRVALNFKYFFLLL